MTMTKPDRTRRQRGFTLVEVMVALVIVALSLGAVSASVSQMADAAISMRERTYASWIAQNKITEMRLANVLPEVAETSGDIVYAGQEWLWSANVSETGVENLYRVDVTVALAASGDDVRTVSGFIGEPVPPGLANAAWRGLSGPPQPGDEEDDPEFRQ